MSEVSDLLGKTLVKIDNADGSELRFTLDTGEQYRMYHEQDCCESVSIEDIIGELDDLIGAPLLMAEEVSSDDDPPDILKESHNDLYAWTFYKFATIKGYVTIRWYGESNGYYSVSVDFERV